MPAGRPLELNPSLIEQTKTLLARCLYIETVADALGINRFTFRRWVKTGAFEQRRRDRGKDPNPKLDLHCELSAVVRKTLADTSGDFLAVLQAHGTQNWTALAWLLERRFPEKWAANRHEIRDLQKRVADLEKTGGPTAKSPPPGRVSRRPKTAAAAE